MRELNIGSKNYTIVNAIDEKGIGNANHEYSIVEANIEIPEVYVKVKFQNGAIKESGVNGCQNEDLIAIVIDRLRGFQSGDFAYKDNAMTLTKLEEALVWSRKRTQDRVNRGVEGLSVK